MLCYQQWKLSTIFSNSFLTGSKIKIKYLQTRKQDLFNILTFEIRKHIFHNTSWSPVNWSCVFLLKHCPNESHSRCFWAFRTSREALWNIIRSLLGGFSGFNKLVKSIQLRWYYHLFKVRQILLKAGQVLINCYMHSWVELRLEFSKLDYFPCPSMHEWEQNRVNDWSTPEAKTKLS